MKSPTIPTTYAKLRKQVEETLILGQRQIEQARIQTYWQTGQLISEHILSAHSRSEVYGDEVIRRLAADLNVGPHLLWRCVRFARAFKDAASLAGSAPSKKIVARGQLSLDGGLKWSHYRELIKVADEERRRSFLQRAAENNWSAAQLREKIRLETGREPGDGAYKGKNVKVRPGISSGQHLIPKKGLLYTYRLIAADSVQRSEDSLLWIDLGFQVHRKLPKADGGGEGTVPRPKADGTVPSLKAGMIIESQKDGNAYSVIPSTRTEADLFTYKAVVERVVDADTLLVQIDLGFDTRVRQYVRLRAIDAPELATPEGKRAAAFVQRELSKVDYIILCSSRSDKYDRYLGDVFYNDIFLNQRLLDEGLARKV